MALFPFQLHPSPSAWLSSSFTSLRIQDCLMNGWWWWRWGAGSLFPALQTRLAGKRRRGRADCCPPCGGGRSDQAARSSLAFSGVFLLVHLPFRPLVQPAGSAMSRPLSPRGRVRFGLTFFSMGCGNILRRASATKRAPGRGVGKGFLFLLFLFTFTALKDRRRFSAQLVSR